MSEGRPRILCVGFDQEIESWIVAAFEDREDTVEIATLADPSEAIEYLESESDIIHCVISSDTVGDASGIAFLRRVRNAFPRLPYVLFVKHLSQELINEAIDADVTDYLPQDGEPQVSRLADRVLQVVTQNQTAERAGKLKRINKVIRKINRELVRVSAPEEIDRSVCEILSESDPYLLAWIGEHNPESKTVTGRAAAGVEEGYLDSVTVTTDNTPTAKGPTGKAVRTHEIQVMQDIPTDSTYEPWREEALKRGYRSSAAIPLVYEETLYGILNVYANRTRAFDAEERALLNELGDTIAHAHHEMRLQENTRQFQRAVEQAADAIFITDIEGTIEYLNPAFEELTGYTASETLGQNPRILKSGEQSEGYYESMWEAILDGEIWEEEVINEDRDGERYHAEQTIAPLRGGSGELEGFVAIQRDITERKEYEEELERSKDRLRLLFDEAPDGMVVHDIEGKVLDVNEALANNLGYTRDELLAMEIFDFEVGIDEGTVRSRWETMDPGSMHRAEIEGEHLRKDGSTYPCEIWISRVPEEYEERDRFIALIRDISDRKERERERQETQRRLELAVNTADAGVWEWDIQSESVSWDESMETLVGLEPGTFDGTYDAFIDRVHPDDRQLAERTIKHAIQDTTGFEQEFRLRHESGDFIWFLTRARLLLEAEGTPERMIGVGIDISDRIDLLNQLEVLDRVLRHNLRNDMTKIQGFAELAHAKSEGVDKETKVIIDTSQQLMETVEKEQEIVELLTERPERKTFDIADVCQRVADALSEDYAEAEIDTDIPDEASVTAVRKIERAISELLENALFHTDRESPEVSLSLALSRDTVQIEIADNGPGIPAEEINVLTRGQEIEPLYHGSGLGLWLVNWIVKLSEGTLAFEENDPRGSIVTIELDRSTESDDLSGSRAE